MASYWNPWKQIRSARVFRDLAAVGVEAEVDHRHLNLDCPSFKGINPTTENLVVVFWKLLSKKLPKGLLHELKLHETENNVAVYRGE